MMDISEVLPRAPHLMRVAACGALLLLASGLFAGETRTWSQSDYSDFENGNLKGLSLRSDGLLTLAPSSHEVFDSSTAFLWSLAQDSKGNLYAGGGTGAKLYLIPPGGKARLLAELDALTVQAVAVDAKDRVYAATAPDGKVYRIGADGKAEVFYDPKAKYIWALAFDSKGNLYVATGDRGEIHRISQDGAGKVLFRADQTHVRSMAVDGKDNLIVGADPGGLVMRISPAGEGFVLYQMPKREVTAVAVARDGAIYAAAVGSKQTVAAQTAQPAAPQSQSAAAAAAALARPPSGTPVTVRIPAPAPATTAAPETIGGGSEVYRIDADGSPRRIWNHPQDVVYAIGFDASGRAILATGNKGNLYRIESPSLYTSLLTLPATQVTAFLAGRDGRLYAATGNVGKVYEIGPGLEREGSIESDVLDASMYSLWGRLSYLANLNGGKVAISARSGNLDAPESNWSPWSAPVADPAGARISSPPARFLQWKAVLMAGDPGRSPELESVDVAYLEKNLEPQIEEIDLTPPNYKFPPAPVSLVPQAPSLSLPPLGRRATKAANSAATQTSVTATTPAMQFTKGWVGARWLASDPNGDALAYTVEIRGVNETEWKPLEAQIRQKYLSWDSTAFPDGDYRLRITASDSPGNPPAEALKASAVSDVFVIDNTPPRITGLSAVRNGGKLQVRWHAADALNNVTQAQYSLDGGDWTLAAPVTKLSDSPDLDYSLSLDAASGEHTIAVRAKDDYENESTEKTVVK